MLPEMEALERHSDKGLLLQDQKACYLRGETINFLINATLVCAHTGSEEVDDTLELLLALADEASAPQHCTKGGAGTKRPAKDSSAPASKRGRRGDVFGALRQPEGAEDRQAAKAVAAVDRGGALEKFSGLRVRHRRSLALTALDGLQQSKHLKMPAVTRVCQSHRHAYESLVAEEPVQMRNPVFPAVILAERFARLDFLKLADVKCAVQSLAGRSLPCTELRGLFWLRTLAVARGF